MEFYFLRERKGVNLGVEVTVVFRGYVCIPSTPRSVSYREEMGP